MLKPKVFLSHASEDKDRFVLSFASKLRSKGIDVWLDKWEMLPGDSLVDKIFEEGIKNSNAFIIVLSKNSINKKWVQEELNAGIIKKIDKGTILIPIRLDRCQVPEALKSTIWQDINDLNNYDDEFERIMMSIFKNATKPAIGKSPKYVSVVTDKISGLEDIDVITFYKICNVMINKNSFIVSPNDIYTSLNELDIPNTEIDESLEILNHGHYIKTTTDVSNNIVLIEVTHLGCDKYFRTKFENYSNIYKDVCYWLVNNSHKTDMLMANDLKAPRIVISHIIKDLQNKNLIKAYDLLNGEHSVHYISPKLKRLL